MKENSVTPDEQDGSGQELNINNYTNKKIVSKGILDLTLIVNNAMQLRGVIQRGSKSLFYEALLVLISLSLILQVTVALLLILDGRTDINEKKKHKKADHINNITTGLILIVCVLNILISSFYGESPSA